MLKVTLREYLKEKTQDEAARAIGVTQGAIAQMVRSDRHIELTISTDGSVQAHEIKPVGRRKIAA